MTNQRPLEGCGQFPLQPAGKILIVFKIMQFVASVVYVILEEKIQSIERGEKSWMRAKLRRNILSPCSGKGPVYLCA